MKLTIFHYHLKPGGVTYVIEQSAKALFLHLPEIESITIVAGDRENADNVIRNIREAVPERKDDIEFSYMPEIGYLEQSSPEGGEGTTVRRIRELLINRYSGSVWWVHNYHLGKNPFFTEALISIAQTRFGPNQSRNHPGSNIEATHLDNRDLPVQKMVFHIHDFPECFRYENLSRLHNMTRTALYADSPNIAYVVINSRDKSILNNAGFKASTVRLLHNPFESAEAFLQSKQDAKRRLARAVASSPFYFDPSAPILLYPVRTIRRKNVLEAGLLARCSEVPCNLIVTLPGVSSQEKPYSDIVESCYRSHLIRGAWGIGDNDLPWNVAFQDAVSSSDCILSSSVQEGFGYLFINAVVWEKPLFARGLSILDGISPVFAGSYSYFYDSFMVPLNKVQKSAVQDEYQKYFGELQKDVPSEDIDLLTHRVFSLLQNNTVDFSLLSPSLQCDLLTKAGEETFQREVRELNGRIYRKFYDILSTGPGTGTNNKTGKAAVDKLFSFKHFADTCRDILHSLSALSTLSAGESDKSTIRTTSSDTAPPHSTPSDIDEIQAEIRKQFIKRETIRLLYRKIVNIEETCP